MDPGATPFRPYDRGTQPPADRATLIARHEGEGAWRLDIRLQGEGETVFLEI